MSYVSRLRAAIGADHLVTRDNGYVLEPAGLGQTGLEQRRVIGRPAELEDVAVVPRDEVLGADRRPEPRHVGHGRATGALGRRPVGPDGLHQPIGADGHPGLGQERREHPALLRASQGQGPTVLGRADRAPEDGEREAHAVLPLHEGSINHRGSPS